MLIVDEVGYIPFDPQAANLMFRLVSRRYEHASMIVTSNPFSGWGEIVGDGVVAAAMIDRVVHHAEIVALRTNGRIERWPVYSASSAALPWASLDYGLCAS